MNRWMLALPLCLAACAQDRPIMVDLGDIDDYQDFLEEQGELEAPEPFKPEPLAVSATGKVRAAPDIAVITAKISAEDRNESAAVNSMSNIVNKVQAALSAQDVETGFTAITSQREFNETCLEANRLARQRHGRIHSDYWFNKRLDDRGDTETKRRPDRRRLQQQVCEAQSIKVATHMVIRIKPAEAAGDALRALSDAGAETANLYGYDFENYDALYQEAAEKAVMLAKTKAQSTARLSGAQLGDIETFSISAPNRTGRFGPQPHIIRPARPYQGQSGSVIDRSAENNRSNRARDSVPLATMTCWDGSVVFRTGECPQYIGTAPRVGSIGSPGEWRINRTTAPAEYETVTEAVVVQEASTELVTGWDGSVEERVIPAVTKTQTRRVLKSPARAIETLATTNALSMSLLSGPQTISVTANLAYTYETPLNGKIIKLSEE